MSNKQVVSEVEQSTTSATVLDSQKRCVRCEQVKSLSDYARSKATKDGRQSWCRECHREYFRKWRDPAKETERVLQWQAKNREHVRRIGKAQAAVQNAIKRGELKPAECCEDCGSDERLDAHHEDYARSKWLDVVWLCRSCHKSRHGEAA